MADHWQSANDTGGCIDVHSHIVPLPLLHELERTSVHGFAARRGSDGWVVEIPGRGPSRPVGPRMTDHEMRHQWMAQAGIDRQVLSPWMDVQDAALDPQTLRAWLRRLNEAMAAEAAAMGPGFCATASVSTADGDQAAADLLDAVENMDLAGLCLTTSPPDGRRLSDPQLEPLWLAVAERAIPVILHPPTHGPTSHLRGLEGLGNVYGRLVETTLAAADLILSGLFDRVPGLQIVLVHGGGFLPYQAARLDGGFRAGEARRAPLELAVPSAYLGKLYYDTVALSQTSIAMLADVVGSDRVVLGSDFPFPIGDQQPVRTVGAAGLPPEQRSAILRDTAGLLFGTPAQPDPPAMQETR